MANTNFLVFDQGQLNMMTDEAYAEEQQRLQGVSPGLANPAMHNKLYRQATAMVKAIADFMVSENLDALDSDITGLSNNFKKAILQYAQNNIIAGKNMWKASDVVKVGDVRYTKDGNGPSWAYLLCSTAGTTGTTEPNVPNSAIIGQTISDNEVTWTVQSMNLKPLNNQLERSTAYKVGDVAYSNKIPTWAYLSCVSAGTTAAEEPSFGDVTAMGKYITDGSVKWIVEDIRFNVPVGVVFYDSYLHDGCVKFNGATVNRADYVRLEKLANDKNLWTDDPSSEPYKYGRGDGVSTMVLPDFRDRSIQRWG